jgi:hypothetical protein
MQIKTTLRFHLTPVRRTINNTNNKNVDANVRKKKPINNVDENVNYFNHYRKQYGSSQKKKN